MAAPCGYRGEHGAEFLHAQIQALLRFYDPIVRDDELGGFHNQLRDDGSVYDATTKHAVGSARFTVNYALASMLYGEPVHKDLCAHGVAFLMERQLDREQGGFAWVLNGHSVQDGNKWCYSVGAQPHSVRAPAVVPVRTCHCMNGSPCNSWLRAGATAFSLLALANAYRAGVDGAAAHIATVHALAEEKYYEPTHGLYIDSFPRDFSAPNPYRGQNANMHMCEAQIALYEATGDRIHLTRATEIAHKLCVHLPNTAGCEGKVVEHYTSDWQPDPEKNKGVDPSSEEYIFRPFGFQPGHSFEWVLAPLTKHKHLSCHSHHHVI